MSRLPMHNRFAEGFVEPHSWGDTIDALSSRILPSPPAIDSAALQQRARAARDAAVLAALSAGWATLRQGAANLAAMFRPVHDRLEAWRERRHAARELCALDDRTLAELGLRRAEIPFVVARPVSQRDQRRALPEPSAAAGNDNQPPHDQPEILPLYFVK